MFSLNKMADVSMRVTKIFVGGLAPEVTQEVLKEYFSEFGTITDSTVIIPDMACILLICLIKQFSGYGG